MIDFTVIALVQHVYGLSGLQGFSSVCKEMFNPIYLFPYRVTRLRIVQRAPLLLPQSAYHGGRVFGPVAAAWAVAKVPLRQLQNLPHTTSREPTGLEFKVCD